MGTVTAYDTAAGKRYRVRYRKPDSSQTDKRGFKTKREAELYLATVEISVARGDFVDVSASRVTVGELGLIWVTQLTHLKPSTQRPLEITWRLHVEPKWGPIAVAAVSHSGVQAWVTTLQQYRGPSTVLRAYGVLASILDVAVADRRIHSNPARGVKLPRKVGREHRYLTHQQVSELAIAAGEKGTIVLLLAYCGLRWGEAAGLRVKDVDLVRRRLLIALNAVEVGGDIHVGTPKTHKRRSVPFPPTLVPMFAERAPARRRSTCCSSMSAARTCTARRPARAGSGAPLSRSVSKASRRMTSGTPPRASPCSPAPTSRRCSGCSATRPQR